MGRSAYDLMSGLAVACRLHVSILSLALISLALISLALISLALISLALISLDQTDLRIQIAGQKHFAFAKELGLSLDAFITSWLDGDLSCHELRNPYGGCFFLE